MLLAVKPEPESLLTTRDLGYKAELQAGWVQRQIHTLLQCGAELRDPRTKGSWSPGTPESWDPGTQGPQN